MKIKNMPNFTGEASLYKSRGIYLTTSLSNSSAASNSVQPSLAIYIDGRFICNGEVTDNGFINCDPIGGGGGGPGRDPVCRPSCGPCRLVPGKGRMKTCIFRNCDDIERRC
jgi:hypothetical protein